MHRMSRTPKPSPGLRGSGGRPWRSARARPPGGVRPATRHVCCVFPAGGSRNSPSRRSPGATASLITASAVASEIARPAPVGHTAFGGGHRLAWFAGHGRGFGALAEGRGGCLKGQANPRPFACRGSIRQGPMWERIPLQRPESCRSRVSGTWPGVRGSLSQADGEGRATGTSLLSHIKDLGLFRFQNGRLSAANLAAS